MFYFDEDHMENGFDAPLASDNEEEQRKGEAHQRQKSRRQEQIEVEGETRKRTGGRLQNDKEWQRTKNSGSTTASSTGSYGGNHCSSEATTGSSLRGFISNRFSDHPLEYEFDGLIDADSESEEQPAELVPLGMRTYSLSGCKACYRKKARSHFSDFYKLMDDHLGSGAFASVKTGISLASGKEFAIKLIDKHKAGHTRSRVMHEIETFNLCKNHPNIVQLHEWFEDHDRFYLVFEKMRGGPLLDHIQRKKFLQNKKRANLGIAHRDVKPENVLCSDIDHVSPVKICDLDLASKASIPSPPRLTNVNSEPDLASPVGSAEFMAPEVVDAFVGDALKYDKRCDMWSLGVIVYIMICGYPPFYGECWRENCGWDQGLACNDCQESLFRRIQRGQFDFPEPEWKNVSEEAKDLICHLLVKNVRQRFTADEVLKHPWVKNGAPETKLQTQEICSGSNDSTRDVHQMQEHFNVMNRIVAARLSARMEQNEHDSDESIDERPILKRSPEYKIFKDIMANKSPTKSVESKQPYNVVTTKVEATFSEPLSNPKNNCTAPAIPFMNGVNSSGTQYPLYMSQMSLAPPLRYTDGVPLLQTRHVILPPSFQPLRQIVSTNGMILYPRVLPQPIYPPQQLSPQQMFHVIPPSYVTSGAVHIMPYQRTYGRNVFHETDRRRKIQCNGIIPRAQLQQSLGGQVRRTMITVRSAGNLFRPSLGNNHPPEQLETCQGAMVKQDSKTDLRQCQARETQPVHRCINLPMRLLITWLEHIHLSIIEGFSPNLSID
ncbi:MAP kinase-interacting serine/threonine-protein kinase 1 [Dirofilaria immitis]|nr:MAP kinase-interacting serine/threonine-protein kinase 1 [Dirofilaria immitis]